MIHDCPPELRKKIEARVNEIAFEEPNRYDPMNIDSILIGEAAKSWADRIRDVEEEIEEYVRYFLSLRMARRT